MCESARTKQSCIQIKQKIQFSASRLSWRAWASAVFWLLGPDGKRVASKPNISTLSVEEFLEIGLHHDTPRSRTDLDPDTRLAFLLSFFSTSTQSPSRRQPVKLDP